MLKHVKLFKRKQSEDTYTRYRRAVDDFMDTYENQDFDWSNYKVHNYSVGFMLDCNPLVLSNTPIKYQKKLKGKLDTTYELLKELDKNPRRFCHRYDWNQFLDYVDWRGNETKRSSQWPGEEWFRGVRTFKEAMDLARYGWTDLDKIIPNVKRFELPKIKNVPDMVYQYHVTGGAVDIGRYLAGVPDSMRRMSLNNDFMRPAKYMQVLFTFDMCYWYSPINLAAAGYRAYEIVEALEKQNIHTEVVFHTRSTSGWHLDKTYYNTGIYDVYVTVKKHNEVLNLSRIMFALAHPAMLRCLIFSENEKNPSDVIKQFGFERGSGYGRVATLPRADFENRDDVIYMVSSDLFSKNSDDIVRAQNEKIRRALTAQKYKQW